MNLSILIGLALKSDEVVEVLECHDVSVIYDFDRLRENSPDVYWASSLTTGFEFRFNDRQVLCTIFMYALPRDNFCAIDPIHAGIPFYSTFVEAKAALQGVPTRTSTEGQRWIKGNFGDHWVHYEFNSDGALALVTVIAADA